MFSALFVGSHAEEAPVGRLSQDRTGVQQPSLEFTEVVPDVYRVRGIGVLPTICNAVVIVNENDVIVVDTYVTPEAVNVLLEELRTITPHPVRYVVNTHFHIDHSFGNQAFPDDVEIIGHEFTRAMIASGRSLSGRAVDYLDNLMGGSEETLNRIRQQLDTVSDAEARNRLERRVAFYENYVSGVAAVVATPPTLTFSDSLILSRGGREIRILFLGRGHTGGDVLVYLPRERVVITGDLLYPSLPFMGDAFFPEWIETLERLKRLEFDWIVGGHGEPFQDRDRIDYLQAYLRDFWAQAKALYESGVDAEEAAGRIDMLAHAEHFPEIQSVGVHPFHALRAYELLRADR